MTKEEILQIAKEYDAKFRGGTGRGLIDEELAELIANRAEQDLSKRFVKVPVEDKEWKVAKEVSDMRDAHIRSQAKEDLIEEIDELSDFLCEDAWSRLKNHLTIKKPETKKPFKCPDCGDTFEKEVKGCGFNNNK